MECVILGNLVRGNVLLGFARETRLELTEFSRPVKSGKFACCGFPKMVFALEGVGGGIGGRDWESELIRGGLI